MLTILLKVVEKVLEHFDLVVQNTFYQSFLDTWWQLLEKGAIFKVSAGRVLDRFLYTFGAQVDEILREALFPLEASTDIIQIAYHIADPLLGDILQAFEMLVGKNFIGDGGEEHDACEF